MRTDLSCKLRSLNRSRIETCRDSFLLFIIPTPSDCGFFLLSKETSYGTFRSGPQEPPSVGRLHFPATLVRTVGRACYRPSTAVRPFPPRQRWCFWISRSRTWWRRRAGLPGSAVAIEKKRMKKSAMNVYTKVEMIYSWCSMFRGRRGREVEYLVCHDTCYHHIEPSRRDGGGSNDVLS